MLLLLISFFAGALTVLAPCVLPVLPVIIGGSVATTQKDKLRPYIIAGSLAGSVIVFTLLLKASTLFVNLSPNVLTAISGGIVIALGCISVVPELWEKLMISLNWQAKSQRFLGRGERNRDKYIGPVLVGVALGPVFASCSPTYAFILASVLPHTFITGLMYLCAYSLGLVLTLLIVALAGRKFIGRFSWAIDTHSWFRRGIGVLFILVGLIIITGSLVTIETWAANHLPFDEAKLEQVLLANQHKSPVKSTSASSSQPQTVSDSVLNTVPTPAPEFQGLTNWINTPPLTLGKLKGKVVLVDFWTYSCINCIRTLPYLEKWYQTYQKDGLVIVGVNTPEFAFEHNPANVQGAVKKDGILYPVVLDNDDDTWNAFNNTSWPADYLIDKNGYIRYVALGEGDYNKTEEAIQALLGTNQTLQTPTYSVPITEGQTPETYFGGERRSDFSGTIAPSPNTDGSYTYTPTSTTKLGQNTWTLAGKWITAPQYITSTSSSATLAFNVTAKDVYVVAGSSNGQPQAVKVSLSSSAAGQYGSDASDGIVQISGSRLYHIASLKQLGNTIVTLTLPAGVSLYTFTFGS